VVISETAGVIGHVLELFAVTHHCPPHTDVYDDYDRLGHLIDDRARPVTSDVAPASRCPDTPDKDPPCRRHRSVCVSDRPSPGGSADWV
jgi:hypothetical protein